MKRKSRFVSGTTLIKWHAVIYILFIVVLWWSAMSTFSHPNNTLVPFGTYQPFILNRIGITIFWGIVFLAHFAFHQMRSWLRSREQQSHLRAVSKIQERYGSSARLDLEQNDEEDQLIDEDDWIAQHRTQPR